MSYDITGASGSLGRAAAEHLLELVDPREVVLTTRRPEHLQDLAARAAGVERIVYTSVPEPVAENPASVVADHAGTEQARTAPLPAPWSATAGRTRRWT